MSAVYSGNGNLLLTQCVTTVESFLCFRDSIILCYEKYLYAVPNLSPFLLGFLWYEEESAFFSKDICKNI